MDLIIGDPHIKQQKIEDGRLFIEKLLVLAKAHKRVIILGDLFDSFALIRSEVLALWAHFLRECPVPVVMLVGNHDYAGQDGGTHALEALKDEHNHVYVADERLLIRQDIHCLPFMRDIKQFEAACKATPPGSILFCHQSFSGCKFGSGYYDPHGADPNCVSHLKGVISGHVHTSQQIFNVWYPGSPFQQNFGEAGDEKFIYSIEFAPEEPFGYRVAQRHDLGMPRYIEIQAESISGLLDRLPVPNTQDSYKFVAKGSPQEILAFRADERFKMFRSKARRVVDALIPERGQIVLPGQDGITKTEKREAYIRSRKWRTPAARLLVAANALLAE
jgi:DNA repair exonuclease SbcCD nuclease subunit